MEIKIHSIDEKPKGGELCLVFFHNNTKLCRYLDKTDTQVEDLNLSEGFYENQHKESLFDTYIEPGWILAWVYLKEINEFIKKHIDGEPNE